jgi:hypothetical protein
MIDPPLALLPPPSVVQQVSQLFTAFNQTVPNNGIYSFFFIYLLYIFFLLGPEPWEGPKAGT